MTPQAVVFDIGDVLLAWQPEALFDRVVGPERRAAFFDAVPIMEMNARVDAGADLATECGALMAAHPDFEDELTLWRDRYIETIGPANDHVVRLLRALRRADVPVYALSNFGADSFARAQQEYPFLEEFDGIFVSAHLGCVKPAPEIYQHLEREVHVPRNALLFVDDRAENIQAAANRGWQTHLFEGAQGFADRLVAAGLIAPEAAQ